NDYFPFADFKLGSTDSVYIAVERRASNDTLVRVLATPWSPTASVSTHFLTASPTNHEKPVISILQTGSGDNSSRKIMVTCIKNGGIPVYFASFDAGSSWTERPLGTSTQRDIKYAVCSSDPDTAGGGYFVAAYQDALNSLSDSITVRRGTLDSLGEYNFKRNDQQASGFMSPSVAIYKYIPAGGSLEKRSAFLYAGVGPTSAFYDQENLPTGIINNNTLATDFRLSQNYPNPFNPATKIDFSLPSVSNVKLIVYDMLGKEVATLVNKSLAGGSYSFEFNGAGLASGMYIYRISVDGNNGAFSEVKKMMLIK
ncbi:MAG TPA: T9SS type A sorting domain-containing protein, partial [Ignavibacteria bacterium]|nr:T9SS type A sorting domain-containing protein [Ignavibacteria bacterium]